VRFCPDANVLVALLVREVHSSNVLAFWDSLTADDEMVGAQLLLPECTSAIREKVSQGELTHDEAVLLMDRLIQLPIRISNASGQFTMALELAYRTNRRKAYDMQYVAVAQAERGQLVTLDGGPYQAAIEIGVPARLLR
jgi:predicted nucleic acid-binding protein